MDLQEFLFVAQLKSTVNKDGYLILKNYSDSSEVLENQKIVFIDVFGDKRKFFVEDFYFSGEQPVIKFKNFDSREDVNFLVGKDIFVESIHLPDVKPDEFFIHEYIGAKIFRSYEFFGILINVESYPGNDVLVIRDLNGKEILIPLVTDFIERIDKDKKEIHLNPGMDLNYDEI